MQIRKKAIVLSIIIIVSVILGIVLMSMSIPLKRLILWESPRPLPGSLNSIWPGAGSTISFYDFEHPKQLRRVPGICIRINEEELEIEQENLSLQTPILVNGIPAIEYHDTGVMLVLPGDSAWQETCWSVPLSLSPGEYLIELTIEGSSTVRYDWAFQITEE